MNYQPKHSLGRFKRPPWLYRPRHSLTPFWQWLPIGAVSVIAFLVFSLIWPNASKAHEINCPEPNRKEIKNQLLDNRKPLELKTRPGDIFNRGALEDLWHRTQLRAKRVKAQTIHVFQKRMIKYDRCIKRAYDHYMQAHASVTEVIHYVFGGYGDQAVAVATCESHLNIDAVNGQYVNIFQMGLNERQTYGWHVAGSPAIVAARSAHNYFVASGYSWHRWSCQP